MTGYNRVMQGLLRWQMVKFDNYRPRQNIFMYKYKCYTTQTPCNFSPLSEIPGSTELLENSLTYEGVQWRKIVECRPLSSFSKPLMRKYLLHYILWNVSLQPYLSNIFFSLRRSLCNPMHSWSFRQHVHVVLIRNDL